MWCIKNNSPGLVWRGVLGINRLGLVSALSFGYAFDVCIVFRFSSLSGLTCGFQEM